jgi:Uma2 family endonuclease
MTAPALITAEELERLSPPNKSVELVRGRMIVREPPGTWHGKISNNLSFSLTAFVRAKELGTVFAQDTGFKIAADPDTVLGPDVSFVTTERLGSLTHRGFAAMTPDLVAEVLSPDDPPAEVLGKVAEWLGAGCRLVWVVDPRRREVRVYHPDGSQSVVAEDGDLSGEDVVPGFSCSVREILS